MWGWVKYFIFLIVAAVIELAWDAALGKWVAPPNLVQLLATGVAMGMGPRRGALVGGFAGLLSDLIQQRPDGVETLSAIAICALAGFVGRRVFLELYVGRWIVVGALLFLDAALRAGGEWAFILLKESTLSNQGWSLTARGLPGMDYTGALAAIPFWPAVYWLANVIDIISGNVEAPPESDIHRMPTPEEMQ